MKRDRLAAGKKPAARSQTAQDLDMAEIHAALVLVSEIGWSLAPKVLADALARQDPDEILKSANRI